MLLCPPFSFLFRLVGPLLQSPYCKYAELNGLFLCTASAHTAYSMVNHHSPSHVDDYSTECCWKNHKANSAWYHNKVLITDFSRWSTGPSNLTFVLWKAAAPSLCNYCFSDSPSEEYLLQTL
jgi:hypothetical protein